MPKSKMPAVNNTHPGSNQIVGGVEEVVGLMYPAIASLERQYEAPLGQRLLVFVKASPSCVLQGGVETILKLQKSKGSNRTVHADGTSTTPTNDDGGNSNTTTNNNNSMNEGGPLASYNTYGTEDGGVEVATELTHNNSSKKTTKISGFLKKAARQASGAAKSATGALERGMHELVIRADQGRTPDLLTVALYTGQDLICTTDSVPLPRISNTITFHIPLFVPRRLDDASHITVKLYIHSQALITATGKSKMKHFLLGSTQMAVNQLRATVLQQQQKGFFPRSLVSNLLNDNPHLMFCVLPDLKIPSTVERGWSLIDPGFSGFATGAYNPPLDQSYLLSTPPPPPTTTTQPQPNAEQEDWLVCTERAMESTVVLPLAAAYAKVCAQACQMSVGHASVIATELLAKRTEQQEPGNCAQVNLQIHGLQVDSTVLQQQQQLQLTSTGHVSLSLAWQPPDNIFELELLPTAQIPLTVGEQPPPTMSLSPVTTQFFPPLVTKGILPAILKAYGGRMPPTGYMLGNLRLHFPVGRVSSNQQRPETWEAMIVLEQYAASGKGNEVQQLPVYSLSTGHRMGSICVSLNISILQSTVNLPGPVSPRGGLVKLVGLEDLVTGVTPSVDFEDQSQSQLVSDDMRRRHSQLATMGNFISYAYLDQHIKTRRQADLTMFHERAKQYHAAVLQAASTAPPPNEFDACEDMSPRPFRPSSSRTEVLLSGIPFNTHNASLSVNVVSNSTKSANGHSEGALFHNITCGAPSDHASGFGNVFSDKTFISPIGSVSGGLRRLEAKRQELAHVVKTSQTQLIAAVTEYFQTARQQQQYMNHVPARHAQLQQLRWKVFEALHAYHHVTWICAVRRASAFSQALGIAVTSYLTSISDLAKCHMRWPELWAQHGYLVSYEGLLSAAGKELGMIEDASVAINMLHMVRVVLVPDSNSNPSNDPNYVLVPHSPVLSWVHLKPSLSGSQTQYLLQIGVHPQYYEQHIPPCLKNGTAVQFFPVLFQVGVDIRQWGAHAGSNMKNQFNTSDSTREANNIDKNASNNTVGLFDEEDDDVGELHDDVLVALNYEALFAMNSYAHLISPIIGPGNTGNPFDAFEHPTHQQPSQQQKLNGMQVHPSLTMLHSHIVNSAGKMNHSILDEAANMAQQLGGGGVVFCKSGKDRTAMHVTYKQSQFANRFRQQKYGIQDILDTTLEDATRMRIWGTRLPICEKNVGQALYAFNALQSKFMPDALKPPPVALAGFLKGGRLFTGEGIES